MRSLAAIALVVLCTCAASAQVTVSASLSKDSITIGQPFSIIVEVENEYPNPPEIPEVEGLDIDRDSPSTRQRQQFGFVNGQGQSTTTYTYIYRCFAEEPGDYTIPPINVRIKSRVYTTEPLSISVLQRGQSAPSTSNRSGRTTITMDDVAFLETRTDKMEVYQGAPIVSTVDIWRLDNRSVGVSPGRIAPPTGSGFSTGRVGKSGSGNSRREVRNGLDYEVESYEAYLYPQGVGEIEIPSWQWTGGIQRPGDFIPRSYDVASARVGVRVKPLPARPNGFSGAVGDYAVAVNIHPATVIQGQPVTYRLTVTGEGIPDFIGAPEFPDLEWAAVAEPEINVEPPGRNSQWILTKQFSYEITPVKPGNHEIPSLKFIYFDPRQESYVTKNLDPLKLTVQSSGEGPGLITFGSQGGSNSGVTILAEDILPILTETGPLRARRSSTAAAAAAIFAPPLGFALFVLYTRRRKRFENDPRYARKYFARSKSRQRLAAMDGADDPADAMYRAVLGFIADHFDVNEAGLTSADARALLEQHGTARETADSIVKVLRACERRRYAGAALSDNELGALRKAAERAMDALGTTAKGGAA